VIARARLFPVNRPRTAEPAWHAGFLSLLPDIRRQLRFAFRHLHAEARQDAEQEALANALAAYLRLYELGKTDLAYASPLARYAARQVGAGRQVACSLNAWEVLSLHAQRKRGFKVASLQQPDASEDSWREMLVEDPRSTPADLAASRLDFDAWLKRLPQQKRRIASMLAAGETTRQTARRFQLTAGRISQLRRELAENWRTFQGEATSAAVATS
jgi:hypothetical protein